MLFCFFVSELFILLFSAGDLGATDYIAISVSLALTVLILSFIGYFLWRAQHGSTMHVDQEMGQVSNMYMSKYSVNIYSFDRNMSANRLKRRHVVFRYKLWAVGKQTFRSHIVLTTTTTTTTTTIYLKNKRMNGLFRK